MIRFKPNIPTLPGSEHICWCVVVTYLPSQLSTPSSWARPGTSTHRSLCIWDMVIRYGDPGPARGSARYVWETLGTFKTDTSASCSMPCGPPRTPSTRSLESPQTSLSLPLQIQSLFIDPTRLRKHSSIARAFAVSILLPPSPQGRTYSRYSSILVVSDLWGSSGATTSAYAGLRYQCSQDSGALLLLKQPEHKTFLNCHLRIKEYMMTHLADWCEFANDRLGIGLEDKDIIFVSGFTKTTVWVAAAFSNNSDISELLIAGSCFIPSTLGEFRVSISQGVHASVSSRVGPHDRVSTWKDGDQNFKYDQCIFLNYFKMKRRGMLRRLGVMRAADGPHTLPDIDDDEGSSYTSTTSSTSADSHGSMQDGKVSI